MILFTSYICALKKYHPPNYWMLAIVESNFKKHDSLRGIILCRRWINFIMSFEHDSTGCVWQQQIIQFLSFLAILKYKCVLKEGFIKVFINHAIIDTILYFKMFCHAYFSSICNRTTCQENLWSKIVKLLAKSINDSLVNYIYRVVYMYI